MYLSGTFAMAILGYKTSHLETTGVGEMATFCYHYYMRLCPSVLSFFILLGFISTSIGQELTLQIDYSSTKVENLETVGLKNQSSTKVIVIHANGGVSIGSETLSTGLKLDVEGKVGANQYCDEAGNNCFTSASLLGGTQWSNVTGGINLPSGNMGIGTTTPAYPLDIVSNSGRVYFNPSGNDSTYYIYNPCTAYHEAGVSSKKAIMFDGTSGGYGRIYGTTPFGLWAGEAETAAGPAPFNIGSNTTVGINDSNPDARLEVTKASGTDDYLYVSNSTSGDGDGLIVTTDGDVGIGTTTPVAKLHVSGYMRLAPQASSPLTCDSTRTGAMALTSSYRLCSCNGTSWVLTSDGSSACVW